MRILTRLIWVVLGLGLFSFAMLAVNQESVALRFLVWQTPEHSLFWWLLLAFVFGLLVGGLSVSIVSLKHRLHERALGKQLARSQQETTRLKAELNTPSTHAPSHANTGP